MFDNTEKYKIYKFNNLKEYYEAQVAKNIRKLQSVWVEEQEIYLISKHISLNIPNVNFGICHGVRNGKEVEWFKKYLEIDNIMGTDISPTALDFKDVIQWDFNNAKPEWYQNVDFIYSNSYDHSHSPQVCLDVWMKCLKPKGICYIHWSKSNEIQFDSADCFAASEDFYRRSFNVNYKVINEINYKKRIIFAIKHGDNHDCL